jgi:hypothetical protein
MSHSSLFRSFRIRSAIGLFFFVSGTIATLLLALSAPSFWYVPCGVLWALSGFVWMIRPSFAPAISAFPVLAIGAMWVSVLRDYKQTDSLYWLLLFCIVIALALIAISFRQREARNVTAVLISLTLVGTAFVVDRLFTNKVEIRSYSMRWSANGSAPWGDVERSEKGEMPVVIYRVVDKGYCYDALFSSELAAQLTATNKPVINVDYNFFKDFGQVRSYNVRAVDGMVFNDGFRAIRSEDAPSYGGYIEGSAYGNCH